MASYRKCPRNVKGQTGIPVDSPSHGRTRYRYRLLSIRKSQCHRCQLWIFSHSSNTNWKPVEEDEKVLVHDAFNHSKLKWLLQKRNEEADNLVRYVYNLCSNGGSAGQVINVRTVAQHYTASMMRRMIFNKRFYGKGSEDGRPGVEEQEHVSALFTVLSYMYAFTVADYLPWLRFFYFGGHEKKVRKAMEVLKKYQEAIVNERVQQWREEKKMEVEDLLDVFIALKDENGNPLLSDDEINAQITEILLAAVDNPANAVKWTLLEMLNQPKQLEKAAEELDRLFVFTRLPRSISPISPFPIALWPATSSKRSSILLSRLVLSRNPKVWKDLLRFDPKRHLKEQIAANQQVSLAEPELCFITFTIRRRSCLGNWLGTTMTVMLLQGLFKGLVGTCHQVWRKLT
ncbi:hypothetical protein FEM48_Zijuj02G0037600 [Ziziphus jujuba var. spinosa]|uniref:Uncharacterized protein n=1 Tax=Ziziphus jujuba var. spinosa TaxID=714518 RepID=A0A978VTF7_ZIZJJ|nr:hypothetical protein FEM48_Zijuj02G0037600 [Ziziphus jujuba var. spinosa]